MIQVNQVKALETFKAKSVESKKQDDKSRLLPDTPITHAKQSIQKYESAFIDYPVKGLNGSVNSNFYEFLAMGIIPYLVGGAMLMVGFNVANRFLKPHNKKIAQKIGNKMALGVVMYGLFKNISRNFVTKPVRWATGVNISKPYQNVTYSLPTKGGSEADVVPIIQQRSVYDSNEFYRKDLLDKEYYDKIGKKLGLGDNLNDSVNEVSPIIQNIISTTKTAEYLSKYMWAALGVGLAVQKPFDTFFENFRNRERYIKKPDESFVSSIPQRLKLFGKNTIASTKDFVIAFKNSCKTLWTGDIEKSFYMRHAGKVLLGLAVGSTIFLTSNTIIRAKKMAKQKNEYTIDKSKESKVI